jgi:hypothetical protein
MRKITVFYAWQSDTPQRFNRHLIRMALEIAASRMNDGMKGEVEVRIDADTEGVPGQPPITDTILQKIAACDIFVPDLTFVAQTDGGKRVPNPNVMTEYGYALRAKPYTAMMSVMNTAYGPPEELPFDIGHIRHPIQYYVLGTAKNAERRAVRKTLADKLEAALRLMVAARIEKIKEDNPFPKATPTRPPAFYFKAGETLAAFGNPGEQEYQFPSSAAVYMRIFPAHGDQPRVGLAKLQSIFDARKPCAMSQTIGGVTKRNSYGPIILDPDGSTTVAAITQGFETGELWGVNSQVFRPHKQIAWNGTPQEFHLIATITMEKIFVRALENYIRILVGELQLRPPFSVELGAAGIKNFYLAAPGGELGNGQFLGPIMCDDVVRQYRLDNVSDNSVAGILRSFFNDLYDLTASSREAILTDQIVAAHGLPSRRAS